MWQLNQVSEGEWNEDRVCSETRDGLSHISSAEVEPSRVWRLTQKENQTSELDSLQFHQRGSAHFIVIT